MHVLAVNYTNLNQPRLAADYLKKAFDLRDRVTEREKFQITCALLPKCHGRAGKIESDSTNCGYKFIRGIYVPYVNLGVDYMVLGQYEKAATETREALRLEPNNCASHM